MVAWVILAGLAIAVVGVIVKVGVDVARDLREDCEAHGGRQTRAAARRAILIAVAVVVLVLALIVGPLLLAGLLETH